ncbi:MAG: nucleoside 2-deoxyribosyltransferase [Methanomicrobiales archaeon]|nr:nucleoside 2-deoxyribosyltransferase [Methanomicrobiales archaeon]
MYVLVCPCVQDPSLRAAGITRQEDIAAFRGCIERCRKFHIDTVMLPCPETAYLGKGREPGSYESRLDTPAFEKILDEQERQVRTIIAERGAPVAMVGVDASPACGVNRTHRTETAEAGRGAFFARFPEVRAIDVKTFASYHIYLAGPLFSEAEQAYNRELFSLLTAHAFEVYLPQEVGDTSHTRGRDEHAAIFTRHREELDRTDMVVAVIDGADADSGTSWEMGYAYARGIPVIALRTDFRRTGHAERVNLMLEESSVVVGRKEDLVGALHSPFC